MSQTDEMAVNNAEVADTTVTESAPVETTTDDGATAQVDDKDVMEMSLEEVTKQVETDGNKEDVADDTAETSPEETKGQLRGEDGKFIKKETTEEVPPEAKAEKSVNRFQQLANRNRELEEQLAQVESRKTQVATEQQLLNEVNPDTGDYYTPAEAERIARVQANQNLQVNLENQERTLVIQQNQQTLGNEGSQVLNDFSIFREFNADGSKNPEFKPQLADNFEQLLGNSLIYEMPDGNQYSAAVLLANGINPQTQATLVGSHFSPYKLAKTLADATSANAPQMQAEAQKATEKMLANVDAPLSASQTTTKKSDPIMDGFDMEVKSWR